MTAPPTVDHDVTISEYGASAPVPLDAQDLALLESIPSSRLAVRPTVTPGHFVLQASSWVGTVALPGRTIRIRPKVDDLDTVLMMFTAAAGLVDWRPQAAGYGETDLVEGVAELVLRTIDGVTRRGLVHGYRSIEERLPVLRGRLDVQQLAARPWDTWPVPCRYDDFTADVAENRVLLATVRLLARLTRQPGNRRSASELLQRLEGVGEPPLPLVELDLVRHTPVNEHYAAALALSRLVLEGFGLTHEAGGHQAVTFLVDMNKLYERWIGAELTERLWPDLEVVEQKRTLLSSKPSVAMAPDLLVRRDGRDVLVADVKYKLSSDGLGRNEDYYQLLAYTTALRLPEGVLIYCRAEEEPARVITVIGGGQRLHCHPVDLSGPWPSVSSALDTLAGVLRKIAVATTKGAGG
jgi:5-methylcytosine-specific restriction enzyme subunit McrC